MPSETRVAAIIPARLAATLGDLTASYDSAFYGVFAQDDWQINSRMKLLFGVRYDVFDVKDVANRIARPIGHAQPFVCDPLCEECFAPETEPE